MDPEHIPEFRYRSRVGPHQASRVLVQLDGLAAAPADGIRHPSGLLGGDSNRDPRLLHDLVLTQLGRFGFWVRCLRRSLLGSGVWDELLEAQRIRQADGLPMVLVPGRRWIRWKSRWCSTYRGMWPACR